MLRKLLTYLVFLVVFWCHVVYAATITASASGGNYSATGAWVGGAVPGAGDDVVLAATSGNITIDGTAGSPSLARSLVTTSYTGTVTMGATAVWTFGTSTAGNVAFVSGMTLTVTNGATINLNSTYSGTNNFTSGGKAMPNITVNSGTGTTWALQDGFTSATNCTIIVTQGGWNFNGQTLTIFALQSSNTNTRAITFGAATVHIGNTNVNTNTVNFGTTTGLTFSAASSTIDIDATSGWYFNGGGLTFGTVLFNQCDESFSAITYDVLAGANSYTTLTFTVPAGSVSSVVFVSGTQTVSGALTMNGLSLTSRLLLQGGGVPTALGMTTGTQFTLSAGTVSATYLNLADCVGAGAGSWNLSAITGLSGDAGNNSGITFTTPANEYWVPSGGTSTGNMSAVTRWASSTGGTAGTGRSPLPQDTAYFDANSIDAGSRTITQDKPWLGSVVWTGVTNTPAWSKTSVTQLYGSITMVSGMTNTGTVIYTIAARGNITFTSGTQTFSNPVTVDSAIGTCTQGDAFNNNGVNNSWVMNSGTWAGASTYTFATETFLFNGGTFTPSGTVTGSASFTMAGGSLTMSQTFSSFTTFTQTGGTLTLGKNQTFTGGGAFKAGTLTGAYTLTVTTIAFTTVGPYTCSTSTISGTTVSFNGSGGTFNVGNIIGTGALTSTAGTVNMAAGTTISVQAAAMIYTPPASSGGAGVSYSRIFGRF